MTFQHIPNTNQFKKIEEKGELKKLFDLLNRHAKQTYLYGLSVRNKEPKRIVLGM